MSEDTKTKTCRECGREFTPAPRHPAQLYCCRKCLDMAKYRHKSAANKRPTKRVATCEHCGKTFHPQRNHPHARFCSRACSARATGGYRAEQRWIRRNQTGSVYSTKPNRTFVDKREIAGRSSFERVSAYLRLSAAERWASRKSLTAAELRLAEKMWHKYHTFEMAAFA